MLSMPNLRERVASVTDFPGLVNYRAGGAWVWISSPLWLAVTAIALVACTSPPKPSRVPQVIVTGCTALPRLQASRQDTLATREAISAYIDKWDALCGPPTEKKP